MLHLLTITVIILQLSIIPWSATATSSEPYCYKNITETSYKVITKTRIKNVSSKNFFKKIISKKDTQIEIYEDQEPVHKIKVERICCEGYKLVEFDLCEPQCIENGCPQHSKCVEPEVCECKKGYFSVRSLADGKHYCQPICEEPCPEYSECVGPNQCACKKGYQYIKQMCKPYCASGCPHGGVCVAPNNCSCQQGYTAERGSCFAICSLGDQCQNGKCIAKDICICHQGFTWNSESFICEDNQMENSSYYPDFSESQQFTDSLLEAETDIETNNDDIDPNQVFDENIETTTFDVTDEYGSSTSSSLDANHKCPDDYVYHKGQCRPLKFVSNEIDCWLKPCPDKNAVCLENGTCSCKEGLRWYNSAVVEKNSPNQTFKAVCLSAAEYEARIQHMEEDPKRFAIEKSTNWTSIFFIILGVVILSAALIFLAFKLFLRQSGEIDVEGKNLSCTYDNRACSEMEKSVT